MVDNERANAEVVSQQLILLGYEAVAKNSLQDLVSIKDIITEFDCVVCDVVWRGYSGIDVWEYFQQQNHHPPFLFISGNIAESIRKEVRDIPNSSILYKPFSMQELKKNMQALESA